MMVSMMFTVSGERRQSLKACCQTSNRVKFREYVHIYVGFRTDYYIPTTVTGALFSRHWLPMCHDHQPFLLFLAEMLGAFPTISNRNNNKLICVTPRVQV